MKLNELIIPLIISALAVCSEWVPELFVNMPYGSVTDKAGYTYETTYKDAVWYFVYGLFILVSMLVIFYKIPKKNIAGQFIMVVGPVLWFSIELFEKICFLAKINNSRLFFNDGSLWQIFLISLAVFGGCYGLYRFKS